MSADPSRPQFEDDDLMAQLRAHYLAGAAGRLEAVDRVLAAARAQPADLVAGDALFRQLHTLAGSAGTYGFKQLSVDSRELEKRVRAAREQGPIPGALLDDIEAFRQGMARTFSEAGASYDAAQPASAGAASAAGSDGARAAGPAATGAGAAPSAFAGVGLIGPDDQLAPDPTLESSPGLPNPAAAAAFAKRDLATGDAPPQKAATRRLVLAVIDGGAPSRQLAADAGTAAALAGAHLACSGPSPAARAYRAAGGDGQVIAFLDGINAPSTMPADGSGPDLPLPCGSRAVRNAMLAHSCDAGMLCGDSADAIADGRAVLRAGRPLALANPSPSLRQALGAPAHLLHEGETLQDAILKLLFALAPGSLEG
jgi:HPt (histidine-containing phosphotransfer) domain-containing protein